MGFRNIIPRSTAQALARDEQEGTHTANSDRQHPRNDVENHDEKKSATDNESDYQSGSDNDSIDNIDKAAQRGVQSAQALVHVWSKRDLILAYIL